MAAKAAVELLWPGIQLELINESTFDFGPFTDLLYIWRNGKKVRIERGTFQIWIKKALAKHWQTCLCQSLSTNITGGNSKQDGGGGEDDDDDDDRETGRKRENPQKEE